MPTSSERFDEAIQHQQQGDVEAAIGQLESLLGDEPDYALAHAALSVFYSQQSEHEKAVQHGQKVCELEPNDPFSFVAMSLICQKAGKTSEAEQALMQARQAEIAVRHAASG
ncbi:MAG: tetratricopeptide repeat protein [Pirellulales bacterium]|nr:tetratricopeptide repeat protein [Pirellulales bacterium]